MGKIPEYQRGQYQSQVNLGNIGAASEVTRAVTAGIGTIAEGYKKQQVAQDLAFVSSQSVQLETSAQNRLRDWQNQHASDPLNKESFLQDSIQKDIQSMGENAPSDEARASFQRMGDEVKRKLSVHGAQWADQQVVKNVGNQIDTASETLQANAYRDADPNQIEDLFRQHDTLLVTAEHSLSPEAVKSIREVGRRQIVANTVEGMIAEKNYGGAERLLDTKQYDQTLGADNIKKAYTLIQDGREREANLQERLLALKDKHPWQYLAKVGETGAVQPLSFAGDNLQQTFADRERFQTDMNQKHGVDLPFVSPAEVDHLAGQLMKLPSRDSAALLSNLANSTTDKQQMLFGKQVFQKEPAIAAAMMIAGDAPEDTRKIIGGMALMRNGQGGKPVNGPKAAQVDAAFDAYMQGAIEDPAVRVSVKQAATAHMLRTKFEAGSKDLETFRDSELQDSIKAITGPVIDINGKKTVSFRTAKGGFLDDDQFGDLVDGLTDDKVAAAQGDVPRTVRGEPINLKKSKGRMTLKAVGDGSYWVQTDEGIALNKDRQPFVLNLKAIAKGEPLKQGFFSRHFGTAQSAPTHVGATANDGGAGAIGDGN